MYISRIQLGDFRVFGKADLIFVHPDLDFGSHGFPRATLPNINLLLGDNGLGKTTLLKAVALAALGPAVGDSGIYPYRLIRREPGVRAADQPGQASIRAWFVPHEQDGAAHMGRIESHVTVARKGDLEALRWAHAEEKAWHPIFHSDSDAFFFVAYGATRRVEKQDKLDLAARRSSSFVRAHRVQSLFEEAYSLVPLNAWLPALKRRNPGRHKQVVGLLNRLMGRGHYEFAGEMGDNEYLFVRNGLKVPFPALSDGYRAFVGWVGDLLYHVCATCPSGKMLADNKGIVMVDEIDLHLHPKWQLTVLGTLARELPNLQFILTSHSPLLVGSLEWMNIIAMTPGPKQSARARRIPQPIRGLDADQVLLTDFFGLTSTRAPGRTRRIKELALQAQAGDAEAARMLLEVMSRGEEGGGEATTGQGRRKS